MKKNRGFTLIELMIVVIIIAVLTGVASVKIGEQLTKAKDGKAVAVVGSWRSANHLQYSDSAVYSLNFSELQNKVDNQTVSLTYGTSTGSAFSGEATQWTRAGKSDNTNNMVSFTITGSAIESTIVFDDTNGNDSKGNPWNTY